MSRMIAQSFVWNSAQFITAPIMAVHEHVDEIQIFDGAYQFMKDAGYAKVPGSTDGTDRIIRGLRLKCDLIWIPCEKFYENETAKKMFMQQLKFWKPDEWKYILSDDELPVGSVGQAFKRVRVEDALVGYVRMWEPYLSKKGEFHLKYLGWKPRFLKWQKGLHWVGKHHQLYNAEGVHREQWLKIALTEMSILHLKHMRPFERLLPQLEYERLDL